MTPEWKPNTAREDQARAEIGVTDISPAAAWFLTILFLALIVGVPLIQHAMGVREWLRSRRTGRPEASLLNTESMGFYQKFVGVTAAMEDASHRARGTLDPVLEANAVLLRSIVAFEDSLDDATFLTPLTQKPVQAFLCRLGAGNEKVLLGRHDWLFYEPAVTAVSGPGFLDARQLRLRTRAGAGADPVAAIVDFHRQLASRGIALVVVPAPSKVTIHPEGLAGPGVPAPLYNASYGQFLGRLKGEGVMVYDCAPTLAERARTGPQYLATDTHWRPEAVQTVAAGLAGFLNGKGVLPPARNDAFARAAPVTVTNRGDITAMLKLPAAYPRFSGETAVLEPVLRREANWAVDPAADVLLLGDSFSNIYSLPDLGWGTGAGLAEQLSFALQRPVDRIARNDSGAYATREILARELARGVDRLAGKKVVIWQFAARELAHGDWKPVELRLGKAARTAGAVEEELLARGTLAAVSTRPQRGAVYRDFVIKFVVEGLSDEKTGRPVGDGTAVVHALAMRNHMILPVANLREGSSLRVMIRPWDGVKARYEGLVDGVLPDPTVELRKPHYWGEPVEGGVGGAPVPVPEVSRTPAPAARGTGFLAACGALAAEAVAAERGGVEGRDGWLFLARELRHLGAGPFWGTNAPAVSRATDAAVSDPLPAIVDFDRQLKALGIELLLMPVPPKAVVYPDKVSGDVKPDARGLPPRTDVHHQAFYRILAEQGVQVLDLTDDFILARREDASEGPVYCMTDTHWAPRACAIAAKRIQGQVADREWLRAAPKEAYASVRAEKEIVGDLVEMSGSTNRPPERIRFARVGAGPDMDLVQPDGASPVVLLADSHGLVFHADADLHGVGAGLPDRLACEFGMPVDLVARRGSAATSVRLDLARRFIMDEKSRKAKKLIIWCLAARDFTESGGWHKIPLSLKK